jgi:hypothetical protein
MSAGIKMDEWTGGTYPYAWTAGAGIIGRLMYHARAVQMGKRKPWTWALLFDLPIALGMGWGAYGLCVWSHLAPEPTITAAIAASYLGPYSVDRIFSLISAKYFGKDKP